ncbi:rifin [Plasmodium reichenowi]|uniref:Rifin n=1 Tax=Plasmodium reichenowi TaxID=5854 RepID=A0A060RRK5_PLARE|nr:rifin [Plasmodium reichenowi]
MKVHYINILLFALPLNILVNNHKKQRTTQKIPSTRLLCECEVYAPANYDNDTQMKSVIDNFNKQTQQKFEEYDKRMQEKRKECKERCDKVSQKIILKDKLEKQMADKLTTLETKIDNEDIPTCVCEKSLADKTEKFCLNCGMNVGGGVTLSSGVLGRISEALISAWQPAAITAAKEAAEKAATALATKAGVREVISKINVWNIDFMYDKGFVDFSSVVSKLNFKCPTVLFQNAEKLLVNSCIPNETTRSTLPFCNTVKIEGPKLFKDFAEAGIAKYETEFALQKEALEATKVGAVKTGFESSISSINAAIIAIVVIILIMVIIYKILRYRRKKKMKKKLQYIKLLEE